MFKNRLTLIFLILTLATIFWLNGCAIQPLNIPIPAKEPAQNHLKNISPHVIVVLGSGSARGFSHLGVLKVLEENHIPVDMIVGTSAGSIVGVLYADHPSAKAIHDILINAKQKEVIDFSWVNVMSGPVSGIGLQKFLLQNLQAKDFNQLKIPFVAVAADLEDGKIHVFGSGPIAPAINASCAVPPYFPPVKLYGRTYVDGGLIDPVAVDVAKRFKPKVIIAIKLDYPLDKAMPSRSPSVFLRGVEMMLLQLTNLSAKNADVIITPTTGELSMFDSLAREKSMQAGESAARQALPKILFLLKKDKIALKNN